MRAENDEGGHKARPYRLRDTMMQISHGHRRSIRLPDYDYAQAAAYFVTICAAERAHYFGEVVNGDMVPSAAGAMIAAAWDGLPARFLHAQLDEFVIMPNHVHGIILLKDISAGPIRRATLGEIIGAFKSITTHEYVLGVRSQNWQPFSGRLWQRDYYEHIIRSESSLQEIRAYIVNNPRQWLSDPENIS